MTYTKELVRKTEHDDEHNNVQNKKRDLRERQIRIHQDKKPECQKTHEIIHTDRPELWNHVLAEAQLLNNKCIIDKFVVVGAGNLESNPCYGQAMSH